MRKFFQRFREALYIIVVEGLCAIGVILSLAIVIADGAAVIGVFYSGHILYGFLALLVFVVVLALFFAALSDNT